MRSHSCGRETASFASQGGGSGSPRSPPAPAQSSKGSEPVKGVVKYGGADVVRAKGCGSKEATSSKTQRRDFLTKMGVRNKKRDDDAEILAIDYSVMAKLK